MILLVEDEYFLANDLAQTLRSAGANIMGPVGTLDAALDMIEEQGLPNVAVLDIDLRGTDCFPLVDKLEEKTVSVIFVTGYDTAAIPERYHHIPSILKPTADATIIPVLEAIVADRA